VKKDIDALIDRYLEIVHSPKNQARGKLWKESFHWNRDMWRGIPFAGQGVIPYTIAPDNSLWTHILGFSLKDYYHDPEVFLEMQLRKQIFSFENFDDDTFYTDELFIWFGVVTELSILGVPIEWFSHKEGWIANTLIKDPEDIKRLGPPDFFKSGLMPRIHQYYEVLREYSRGRLKVMFPEWVRGPLCLSMHLRGMSQLLMEMMVEPEIVHSLMRFVCEAKKHWDEAREKFLGEKLVSCNLYNDEIDCPTVSPDLYRDLIFPYEKEIGERCGRVKYWHSCGNTTAFQDQIKKLPNLALYHCGPWSDFAQAIRIMKPDTAVDLCLNPQSDVVEASEGRMRGRLKEIRKDGGDAPYSVRADAFMVTGAYDGSILKKIQAWSKIAREVLSA
jgi:uroporphyrinogen-III decarboxylase